MEEIKAACIKKTSKGRGMPSLEVIN